jgi:hypothetical protein
MSKSAGYYELTLPDERESSLSHSLDPHSKVGRSRSFRSLVTPSMLLAIAAISVPLGLFSVLLIYFVYANLLHHSPSISGLNAELDEPGVYYVNFPATRLVLLSSFSSTAAPIITGYFMSLLSYSISRRMVRLSEAGSLRNLPTPHQLGFLIISLDGSPTVLWDWFMSLFRGGRYQVGVVKTSLWGLTIANILT